MTEQKKARRKAKQNRIRVIAHELSSFRRAGRIANPRQIRHMAHTVVDREIAAIRRGQ